MNRQLPTCGQLERDLSQKIYKLYSQELEHSPQKITCTLFNNRLAIVIEEAITAVEKTLIDEEHEYKVAKKINSAINEAIKSKLKDILREVLAVEVDDILLDSSLESKRTGMIVTLTQPPLVRYRKSTLKIKEKTTEKTKIDLANLE